MTTEDSQSRQDRFEKWNPYAEFANRLQGSPEADTVARLAIAFEIAQLRAEIHFAGKRSH